MEKSAAKAACCPSFPKIPMPTSDFCIIPTSLTPSPIAATCPLQYCLIPSTTKAFCLGVHLL